MNTNLKNISLSVLSVAALMSCDSNDDEITRVNTEAPTTYAFTRNSASTVNFSGQTTRIEMSEQVLDALKDNTLTEAIIDNKFAHVQGSNDFNDPALNASDKSVRSKVAASLDYYGSNSTEAAAIKADFDGYIAGQVNEVFPAWNTTASKGVAGNLQQAGGGTIRYINADGLEYNQAFAKGLLGGLMTDQMLNNYLSQQVLDEGDNRLNNDNQVLESGKNYTTMEHKWDEAYGYLYGAEPNPATPILDQDSFLGEYLDRVESDSDFTGIAATIYDAFKLGRAAIVAGDYDLRDQQAEIIKENISKIPAVRAVFYLQNGKGNLDSDNARAFHAFSEAYGFVYSLQFTRKPNSNQPYFTRAEVQTILDQLTENDGFWDVTDDTLDTICETISSRFGFTVEQAAG
ncbi:DUF4856 domain-containing protein [Nonlabens antarcticus]|uniref:DUF4856 domain-containing protein n=1 Tax=Nonlabens antarcticus TaxID=392714 RepID=UPI001E39FAFA|nr:DUF4856 domain-containing protein [Nonlabens antarcticus]